SFGWSAAGSTMAIPLAIHPFPDLIDPDGYHAHRSYGMGIVYGTAGDEPLDAIAHATGVSAVAATSPDIDGDGAPDALSAANQPEGTRLVEFFSPSVNGPESWLQTIVSSAGATTQITYLPFPRTQSSAREPAWVVTKIATTGPGIANVSGTRTAANAQYYSYANLQAPGHPWNDPQRLEPFGFADTYVQDVGSLQVVHTRWGGDHVTAGRQTSV